MRSTSVASIYGMSAIVNSQTQPIQLFLAFVIMGLSLAGMLWWSKRQGWW